VLRARRSLGAYRIPRRPAFSSHLINAVLVHMDFKFVLKMEKSESILNAS
jgi:hypothetical protein